MFSKTLRIIPVLLIASSSWAELLPGFSLEEVVTPEGFTTSIAFDSEGFLHYTTMDGGLFRVEDGVGVEVARVDSANEGNAAFLGMAFAPDGTAVVHYVTSDLTADVVSRIDLETREETVLARLEFCSKIASRCPTEHHGGNPDVAEDGSIYFGIGDYGLHHIAQRNDVYAAKIYRIDPAGTVEVWAMGFRNPFDLAWDETYGRIIAEDNGASGASDEIVFVQQGENHGWPLTMGTQPPVPEMTPPVFVFSERTAPTGLDLVSSETGWFRSGILVSSFVTRALYFFPSYDETSVDPPVVIFSGETLPLIDVRQAPGGDVYVASGFTIFRLTGPRPGDVNGDGEVTRADYDALIEKLNEGGVGIRTVDAHEGSVCVSWGADVDQNGQIDSDDLAALARILSTRRRGVEHRAPVGRGHPVWRYGRN